MRLTYKAQDQHGKETGTVWYAVRTVGNSIFPKSDQEEQVLKKLATYEDAEEEGRLVILPCKVGDKVFRVIPKCLGSYIHCPFQGGYGLGRCYNCDAFIKEESFCFSIFEDIGKTIFLTHEEAEVALKGAKK